MTEKEKSFFDRKLANTTGEAWEKTLECVVRRCVQEAIEQRAKKELNKYYINTNFGI